MDPSEIIFSALSKKAWKSKVICINSKWRRQVLQYQATPISLHLTYNYDPRLLIIIIINNKGGDCGKSWESVEEISREAVLGNR